MSEASGDRESLEREFAQVMRELERREYQLAQLEKNLGESEGVLRGVDQEHMIRVGDVIALQQAEVRRKSVTKDIAQFTRKLEEAREDVRRARERRDEVEAELKALP